MVFGGVILGVWSLGGVVLGREGCFPWGGGVVLNGDVFYRVVCMPPFPQSWHKHPPSETRKAGGTHQTGMLSCFV